MNCNAFWNVKDSIQNVMVKQVDWVTVFVVGCICVRSNFLLWYYLDTAD
jgi:hypothetical protein